MEKQASILQFFSRCRRLVLLGLSSDGILLGKRPCSNAGPTPPTSSTMVVWEAACHGVCLTETVACISTSQLRAALASDNVCLGFRLERGLAGARSVKMPQEGLVLLQVRLQARVKECHGVQVRCVVVLQFSVLWRKKFQGSTSDGLKIWGLGNEICASRRIDASLSSTTWFNITNRSCMDRCWIAARSYSQGLHRQTFHGTRYERTMRGIPRVDRPASLNKPTRQYGGYSHLSTGPGNLNPRPLAWICILIFETDRGFHPVRLAFHVFHTHKNGTCVDKPVVAFSHPVALLCPELPQLASCQPESCPCGLCRALSRLT